MTESRTRISIGVFLIVSGLISQRVAGQTCEEIADRQARIVYNDTYIRALNDCRSGNPLQCRTNVDCALSQLCTNGRCVSRPQSCLANCGSRDSNGTCSSYLQDYCGIDPVCVPNCTSRYSNATCSGYGADICGPKPLSCVQRCIARYSNGTCSEYGSDVCGIVPSCHEVCTARYSNGVCYQYGPDQCTQN